MSGFGNRIDFMLYKRGISKPEFAKMLGISHQQMHFTLKDKSLSTVTMLQEISKLLDVPSDYLLQDFDKRFLIFAIDDYLNVIDRDRAQSLLNNFTLIMKRDDDISG